jgi:ribosomal protein S27AE
MKDFAFVVFRGVVALAALAGTVLPALAQYSRPTEPNSGELAVGLVLLLILGLLYFLPSIIAYWRGHAQRGAILILNLALGWTLIGCVAALVWASTNPQVVTRAEIGNPRTYSGPADRVPADNKVCPRCAETVKAAALVCRYCGHEFPQS